MVTWLTKKTNELGLFGEGFSFVTVPDFIPAGCSLTSVTVPVNCTEKRCDEVYCSFLILLVAFNSTFVSLAPVLHGSDVIAFAASDQIKDLPQHWNCY